MKIFKSSLLLIAITSMQAFASGTENLVQTDAGYQLIVKFKNPQAHQLLKSTPETTAAMKMLEQNQASIEAYAKEHHVNSDPMDAASILTPIELTTGLELGHSRSASLGYDELTVKTDDIEASIKTLMATGQFVSVEPVFKVNEASTVNDPMAGDQFYLKPYATRFKSSSNFNLLHAGITNNLGRKVRFAVLDSGSWDHEDVQFAAGYNFVNDKMEPGRGRGVDTSAKYTKEDGTSCQSSHGLAVASIIGATRNNGVGIIGAFPSEFAELVPVRVLGCAGGSSTDVVEGLLWAAGGEVTGVPKISKAVDIANLSLGSIRTDGCSRYEQDMINKAVELGVKVVVAAGNNNIPATNFAPGSCANVINVGAITNAGDKANFSNYGSALDVVAEGDSVYVADLNVDKPNSYANGSGTSFAAPLVAGLVGAMFIEDPSLTGSQIEARLKYTSILNPSGNINSNCNTYGCGAGLVQVKPAMNPQQEDNVKVYSIRHRYQGFSTAADVAWMTELQPKATACQTLKYTFGSSGIEQAGITYKLHVSTNGGTPNFLKEVSIPQFIYPTPDNATLSFQRCENSSCSALVPMYKGVIEKPAVCR
jgi:hypothetical protein